MFSQTSRKKSLSDTCVVATQKSSLCETFFWATRTYVWLDYNITMMSDTCVVFTQKSSLCETFFERPEHMFGMITISRWNSCTFRLMYLYILFSSINNIHNISLPLLVNTVLWLFCIICRLPWLQNKTLCIVLYIILCIFDSFVHNGFFSDQLILLLFCVRLNVEVASGLSHLQFEDHSISLLLSS